MWCCNVSLGSRPNDMATVIAGLKKVQETMQATAAAAAASTSAAASSDQPAEPATRPISPGTAERSFEIPLTNPGVQPTAEV